MSSLFKNGVIYRISDLFSWELFLCVDDSPGPVMLQLLSSKEEPGNVLMSTDKRLIVDGCTVWLEKFMYVDSFHSVAFGRVKRESSKQLWITLNKYPQREAFPRDIFVKVIPKRDLPLYLDKATPALLSIIKGEP